MIDSGRDEIADEESPDNLLLTVTNILSVRYPARQHRVARVIDRARRSH